MKTTTTTFDGEEHSVPSRDSQRQKLYDAENEAFPAKGKMLVGDGSMGDLDRRVRQIVGSRRWQDLADRAGMPADCAAREAVVTHDGSGCGSAFERAHQITMPRWARTEIVLLHELAHVLAPRSVRHHWPFARLFLDLVSTFSSHSNMLLLRESFRKHGVRYAPKRKRVMSPEAKALLAERGRVALAACRRRKEGGK